MFSCLVITLLACVSKDVCSEVDIKPFIVHTTEESIIVPNGITAFKVEIVNDDLIAVYDYEGVTFFGSMTCKRGEVI